MTIKITKTIFLICIIIVSATLMFGCSYINTMKNSNSDYIFANNSVFDNLEKQGLIEIKDTIQNNSDATLRLEGVFCDQINTYIKIESIDSNLDFASKSLNSYLEYCIITDTTSNKSWESNHLDNNIEFGNYINSNESIIEILGGPDDNTMVNIEIKLKDIDESIVFKNELFSVCKATKTNVEDFNYTINLPETTGKIKSVIYTPLKTQFLVDWEFNDIKSFSNQYIDFIGNHNMKLVSGDKQADIFIYPHGGNGSFEQTGIYNAYIALDKKDNIKIKVDYINSINSSETVVDIN